MAEIRVERKPSNLWISILGLVLLALLAWGLSQALVSGQRGVDGGTAEMGTVPESRPRPFNGPVAHAHDLEIRQAVEAAA